MENPENIEKCDGSRGVAFKTIAGITIGALIGYGATKIFPKATSQTTDFLFNWHSDGLVEKSPKKFASLFFPAIGGFAGGIGALITGSQSSKSR